MVGGARSGDLAEVAREAVRGRHVIRIVLTITRLASELCFCALVGGVPLLWFMDDEVRGMERNGYLVRVDGGDRSVFREPCSVYEPTERMLADLRTEWAANALREL